MYRKFIINQDGVLKFGNVYQHRDLLAPCEDCLYGGGLWEADENRGIILLYGRSFEFGAPDFTHVRRVDWEGTGGTPRPLFFLSGRSAEERLVPVYTIS